MTNTAAARQLPDDRLSARQPSDLATETPPRIAVRKTAPPRCQSERYGLLLIHTVRKPEASPTVPKRTIILEK